MAGKWHQQRWGDLAVLEYGKGLKGYENGKGTYRVFGTNGPIGWTSEPLFKDATVVVGRKGAYRGIHFSSEPCFVIDTAFYLVPKVDFDMKWAYYELLTHDINAMDSGSAIPTTSRDSFYLLSVNVPPLPEQHVIADILGTFDYKIAINQEMNKTLEKIGQALFKHWFIDFEFPNEKGKPYKSSGGEMVDSEMGEIPKGWQVKKVGDVIDIFGGTTPSTKESKYWEGGTIHWATPKDLSELDSPVLIDTERKITPQGLATISSGLLPAGTVLLSSRAPIGYTAISQIPVSINQGFIAMVCSHELPNYYVFSWVQFNLNIIKSVASGTTFEEVNKSNFRRLDILVPPSGLLSKFSTIFGSLYECILNNSFKARTLASVRDSLLPRLMSGQIRVPAG